MSTVATVVVAATDPSTHLLAEGLNGWVQNKSRETIVTVQVVGSLVGVIAALFIAAKGRFAIGSVIMGGVVGGLICWVVFGVTDVKEQVDQEVKGGSSPPAGVSAPAFPSSPLSSSLVVLDEI